MRLMAHDAGHLTVLTRCLLPLREDLVVTAAACLQDRVVWKVDPQWCMNTFVTGLAVVHWLGIVMTIVTLCTVRDIAMLLMVAALAILLAMHAWELGQFLFWTGMTVHTGLTQTFHGRHL